MVDATAEELVEVVVSVTEAAVVVGLVELTVFEVGEGEAVVKVLVVTGTVSVAVVSVVTVVAVVTTVVPFELDEACLFASSIKLWATSAFAL